MNEYTTEDVHVTVTKKANGVLSFETNLNKEWVIKLLEFAVEELKKHNEKG